MFDPDTSFFDTGLALSPHDRKSFKQAGRCAKTRHIAQSSSKKMIDIVQFCYIQTVIAFLSSVLECVFV